MTSLSDHESGHDSSHEGGDGGGHRNTKKFTARGMTAKKNIIHRISKGCDKYSVRWSVKGLPIGENGTNLITFIGTKKHFDVDDTRKDWILKEAGKLHRHYRSDVTKKYLKNPDGTIRQEPPPLYSEIITKEDWSLFVHIRTTDPAFLKKSKKNKESASNPEYPYRGGSSGYQILEERLLVKEGKDPTQESVDRCTLWIEGRLNKDGDVVDPKTKEVKDRIESISQSVSQGECSGTGEQDILARALGREEYNGRTRGYGYGIPPTTAFGPKTPSTIPCAQCKVMAEKYDQISKNVDVLMEERVMYKQLLAQSLAAQSIAAPSPAAPPLVAPSPVAPSPAAPSPGQDSARDSCTMASTQDNVECELYLANPHRKVAVGMLCNQFSATMHNLPMLENHLRVRVDYSIEGSAPLPVPIVNADIFTVGQALSTFVAWPAQLVVVPQKSVSKARSRPSPSTDNKCPDHLLLKKERKSNMLLNLPMMNSSSSFIM